MNAIISSSVLYETLVEYKKYFDIHVDIHIVTSIMMNNQPTGRGYLLCHHKKANGGLCVTNIYSSTIPYHRRYITIEIKKCGHLLDVAWFCEKRHPEGFCQLFHLKTPQQ